MILNDIEVGTPGILVTIFASKNRGRFWVKSDRSVYRKVDPRQIVCVEALDHHCRFHFKDQSPIVTNARLKSEVFDKNLSHFGIFYLLNRSTIINLEAIDQIEGNRLIMNGYKPLKKRDLIVSKDRRKELFELLGVQLQ